MLGHQEVDGKECEFHYDRGQYLIIEIVKDVKKQLYKSHNSQEAYKTWNSLIGRKKGFRNDERKKEKK
ncbi:hypothetical protein [Lachnobacterium bovis]|nr:hypothetical protein [Lachnobacterium bovis]